MASVKDIAPDWITFYRASDWGVEWKRPPVWEGLSDPETYIHHGAGGRFGTNPVEAMRRLQKWYHDVKNYSTIAYDIMVHRNTDDDTMAICGAREGWLTAATQNRNDIGEAICLMGYFHPGSNLSEHPTDREIEALAFAVAWSIEMGWSAPDTTVLGHRDNPAHPGATACPGDYLYPHVPSIGERAMNIYNFAHNPQKDDDMITLPKPKRIYDSRLSGQAFNSGETRPVNVGPGITEAFVSITAIHVSGPAGYFSVNDPNPTTSAVNYTDTGRLENNGVPVTTPNGQINITNTGGTAHVVIDMYQQK